MMWIFEKGQKVLGNAEFNEPLPNIGEKVKVYGETHEVKEVVRELGKNAARIVFKDK